MYTAKRPGVDQLVCNRKKVRWRTDATIGNLQLVGFEVGGFVVGVIDVVDVGTGNR